MEERKLETTRAVKSQQLNVKCINIQGLTNVKITELENIINKDTLLCLTETQLKIDKVKISEGLKYVENMRESQDKKGGGLMMLWRNEVELCVEKIDTKLRDILYAKCSATNLNFHIALVYFPCGNKEEDNLLRKGMQKELEEILEEQQHNPLLILGDFNGHVGFLGQQRIDEGEK